MGRTNKAYHSSAASKVKGPLPSVVNVKAYLQECLDALHGVLDAYPEHLHPPEVITPLKQFESALDGLLKHHRIKLYPLCVRFISLLYQNIFHLTPVAYFTRNCFRWQLFYGCIISGGYKVSVIFQKLVFGVPFNMYELREKQLYFGPEPGLWAKIPSVKGPADYTCPHKDALLTPRQCDQPPPHTISPELFLSWRCSCMTGALPEGILPHDICYLNRQRGLPFCTYCCKCANCCSVCSQFEGDSPCDLDHNNSCIAYGRVVLPKVESCITRTLRQCSGCSVTLTKNRKCSGCKAVYYCSPECQKKHWKIHKPDCKLAQSSSSQDQ